MENYSEYVTKEFSVTGQQQTKGTCNICKMPVNIDFESLLKHFNDKNHLAAAINEEEVKEMLNNFVCNFFTM